MSEVKHTPLPWSVDNTDGDQGHLLGQPSNHCSDVIGTLYDLDLPEGQANARLIVQAVNSHGDLVEALREMVKWNCVRGKDNLPLPIEEQEEEVQKAMRALSKVLELGEGL